MKKKVYIAGRLNDMAVDYLLNCHKMMTIAEDVRKAGYSVYIPCIDYTMGMMFGWTKYEDYFDNSQPWLEVANAVFLVPGWEMSSGTRREMERADVLDIPIFDNIEKMNEHFNEIEKKKFIQMNKCEHNFKRQGAERGTELSRICKYCGKHVDQIRKEEEDKKNGRRRIKIR